MASVFGARRAQILSRYSVTNDAKVMTDGWDGGWGAGGLPAISSRNACQSRIASSREEA